VSGEEPLMPDSYDKMTKIQTTALVAALKAYPGKFAQPSQATALQTIMESVAADQKPPHKLPAGFAKDVADAFAPFFNASQQLQALKKLGLVADELSATARAEADALKAALKA
jgi:hypothetical protein